MVSANILGVAALYASAVTLVGPRTALDWVAPLIGTEGTGSEYGGMMPMSGVPFGSMHLVTMTRTNGVGRTSFIAVLRTRLPQMGRVVAVSSFFMV